MKILRYLGILAGVIVLAGLGFLAWLRHDIRESMKTDSWSRDGPPSAEVMKRLAEWNYPASIFRVVEIGYSSRANGDGEELTIYCFPPADVPKMRACFGGAAKWNPGFPENGGWRWHIDQNAPRDLRVDWTASPEDYIHLPPTPTNNRSAMIDVVRGISYQIITDQHHGTLTCHSQVGHGAIFAITLPI